MGVSIACKWVSWALRAQRYPCSGQFWQSRMGQSVPLISVSLASDVITVVIPVEMPILLGDNWLMFKVHVAITT